MMQIVKPLLLAEVFILLQLVTSCVGNNKVPYEIVKIDTKNELLGPLLRWQNNHNQANLFYAHDFINHSIICLDLKENSLVKNIVYRKKGPDKVDAIVSFYYHNDDSIFIQAMKELLLTNAKSKVLKRWSTIYNGILPSSDCSLIMGIDIANSFNKKENVIYIGQAINKNDCHDGAIIGFDINNQITNYLKNDFPAHFQKEGRFLGREIPYICYADSILIYNYSALSDIFVYNFTSDSTLRFPSKSKFSVNEIGPYNNTNYWNEEINFRRIGYNFDTEKYFGVHTSQSLEDFENDINNNVYLRIFNKKFTITNEIVLGDDIRPMVVYYDGGYYLPLNNPPDENYIYLKKFLIDS